MAGSDAELIARVVERDDRHAFGQLVLRHQSQVRGLLRRLTCGDAAWADDLAQDTFLRAFKGMRRYRGGAQFSTWLYRIATNVFLSDRSRRREVLLDGEEPIEGKSEDPRPQADLRQDLQRAMSCLNERERAALALTFGAGATHEDAARILECPLGTVKTHIARAKEKLRRRLRAWDPGATS